MYTVKGDILQNKTVRIGAYVDAITRANKGSLQEAIRMSGDTLTLEEIFEEAGFITRWEARGMEKGVEKTARNALAKGYPPETIHDITGLDLETIKRLGSG